MSDCIDRKTALDLFLVDEMEDDKSTLTKECENYILHWVQNKLAELPVIYDAVSVIRCKDCKHFDPHSSCCKYSGWLMDGDSDFCSRGFHKNWVMRGDNGE